MQRMSRRNQLPVLRAPYDTQDEPFQPRPSPRNNEQETRVLPYTGNNTERQSRGPSRLDRSTGREAHTTRKKLSKSR